MTRDADAIILLMSIRVAGSTTFMTIWNGQCIKTLDGLLMVRTWHTFNTFTYHIKLAKKSIFHLQFFIIEIFIICLDEQRVSQASNLKYIPRWLQKIFKRGFKTDASTIVHTAPQNGHELNLHNDEYSNSSRLHLASSGGPPPDILLQSGNDRYN